MKIIQVFNIQLQFDSIGKESPKDQVYTILNLINERIGKEFEGQPQLTFNSTDEEIQNGDIITEEKE